MTVDEYFIGFLREDAHTGFRHGRESRKILRINWENSAVMAEHVCLAYGRSNYSVLAIFEKKRVMAVWNFLQTAFCIMCTRANFKSCQPGKLMF